MAELQYIEIEKLHPHPDNPRKELGDISELADSIRQNGIFQNLTVVPDGDSYTVIIGHRRMVAAKAAGLDKVPCVVADMTPKEQLQTMLLENMQRSDLTVYEQAQGFQLMLNMGSTVEEIAEKSGFSQTTVRRRVKMMELDQATLREVSKRQLSLADFDKLAQIEDIKIRNKCLEEMGTHDFNRSVAWELKRQETKKKLPLVKKLLKEMGAKELKPNETWGSAYEGIGGYIYVSDWEEDSPLLDKKVSGQLFYTLDKDSGCLRFFKKHKRAAPEKKSSAQLAKEKRIADAWAMIHEQAAVAYQLRSDFVKGLRYTQKNANLILKGALLAGVLKAVDYMSSDQKTIMDLMRKRPCRTGAMRFLQMCKINKENRAAPNSHEIIYTDPPWNQKKGGLRKCKPNQARALDYPVPGVEDIFALHRPLLEQADEILGLPRHSERGKS